MKVSELMALAKTTAIKNLAVGLNEDSVLGLINLAITEVSNRLDIGINTATIDSFKDVYVYKIEGNVNLIMNVVNEKGESLPSTTQENPVGASYRLLSYDTFVLNKPKDELLTVIYKASPDSLTMEDTIPLPNAATTALLAYIGYIVNNAIVTAEGQSAQESYLRIFEANMQNLIRDGYKVNKYIKEKTVQQKGFV